MPEDIEGNQEESKTTKRKSVEVDAGGRLTITPKTLLVVLTIIFGGSGGFVGFQFVTKAELEQSVDDRMETKIPEYAKPLIEEHSKVHDDLNGQIKLIKDDVTSVKTRQIQQTASQEADRLTRDIKNARRRLDEYERLRRINEDRLKAKKEPCYNPTCSN